MDFVKKVLVKFFSKLFAWIVSHVSDKSKKNGTVISNNKHTKITDLKVHGKAQITGNEGLEINSSDLNE